MTSLEKAINLGYLFLTYKQKKPKKTHQYIHLFLLNVLVCFFLFFRFIGKKKVPQINGLFLIGHILEPNLDDFETKSL